MIAVENIHTADEVSRTSIGMTFGASIVDHESISLVGDTIRIAIGNFAFGQLNEYWSHRLATSKTTIRTSGKTLALTASMEQTKAAAKVVVNFMAPSQRLKDVEKRRVSGVGL
jgi:hypothetical protein